MSLLLRVISTVAYRQPDIIESSDAVRRLLRQHFNRMVNFDSLYNNNNNKNIIYRCNNICDIYNSSLKRENVLTMKEYTV